MGGGDDVALPCIVTFLHDKAATVGDAQDGLYCNGGISHREPRCGWSAARDRSAGRHITHVSTPCTVSIGNRRLHPAANLSIAQDASKIATAAIEISDLFTSASVWRADDVEKRYRRSLSPLPPRGPLDHMRDRP
jgi:hypothetical protein